MSAASTATETVASLDTRIRAIAADIGALQQQRQELERRRELLVADGKNALPERWVIAWYNDSPTLESPANSCRDYECCGGTVCGSTLADAMAQIARHFESQKAYWADPVTLLVHSGYDPKDYDFTGIASAPKTAAA